MDFVQITQTLGFPVAVAFACGWFIFKSQKEAREDNNKREERMFTQLERFGTSLERFNETLVKIDTRLAAVEKKIEG